MSEKRHEMVVIIKSDEELRAAFDWMCELGVEQMIQYAAIDECCHEDKIQKAREDALDLMVSKGFLDLPVETIKGSVVQEIQKALVIKNGKKYKPNCFRRRGPGGGLSAWPDYLCP